MKNHLVIITASLIVCYFPSLMWGAFLQTPTNNTLEIQIVGLPQKLLKNIFERLAEKQAIIKDEFTPGAIMKFYYDIPQDIKEGIKPYGYFKPHINSYIHNRQPHFWFSHFSINPGPHMRFTHVELRIVGQGSSDIFFQRVSQHFPIKSGDFFDSKKYEESKSDLFNIAATRGFFKAKMLTSQIKVNLSSYQANIIIVFDTGSRFRFNTTCFSPTPFDNRFMQRFLQYRQGYYFNQEKIKQTREGLTNSNYFSTAIITPEPQKAKGLYIPVRIHLQIEPKKQYGFGLGYGTDTGPRALVSTNFRWINRYGHRFNAYLRASHVNSALVARYSIPGRNPAIDQYTFTSAFLNRDQETRKGTSGRLSVGYQTIVGGWQQIISLTELRERYNLTGLPRTNSNVLYLSTPWQRIHADNLINPKHGYSLVVTISGGIRNFLSKTSFFQTRVDGRFLFTLRNQTRFLIRSSLGYTSIKNIDNLPLSLQFFAGGAQSVRGFSYNSIASGRCLIVGSFEIQQKIMKSFYLAGFIDTGNVSNQLSKRKLKIGLGPGFVLLTPVGMCELTIANAINELRKPWVIQFSIGSPL